MNANPDLADLVVTYIKELWPLVDAKKVESKYFSDEEERIFSIEVNSHMIGAVCYGVFATWDFTKNDGVFRRPTDPDFFVFIRHWAIIKAGLNDPKISSVS